MNRSLQKKKRTGKTIAKINAMDLSSCIDMTGPKSIARQTLSGMSATHIGEVDEQLNKSLKKKINREVKGVIVDIAHREYAPGTCSDGGIGTIRFIDDDGDGMKWCSVAYVLDNRIETGIDLSRITVQRHSEVSVENVLPGRIVAKPDKTPLE